MEYFNAQQEADELVKHGLSKLVRYTPRQRRRIRKRLRKMGVPL
jgi:hypothetical protein